MSTIGIELSSRGHAEHDTKGVSRRTVVRAGHGVTGRCTPTVATVAAGRGEGSDGSHDHPPVGRRAPGGLDGGRAGHARWRRTGSRPRRRSMRHRGDAAHGRPGRGGALPAGDTGRGRLRRRAGRRRVRSGHLPGDDGVPARPRPRRRRRCRSADRWRPRHLGCRHRQRCTGRAIDRLHPTCGRSGRRGTSGRGDLRRA